MSENVNTTMNGTQPSRSPSASTAEKNWCNLYLLPDVHCFVNWQHYHRNNCLQDENHEKADQLFDCKHGYVRSVVSDNFNS